jgi:hypothetical protein
MNQTRIFVSGAIALAVFFTGWKIATNNEVRLGFAHRFVLQDLRVNSESADVEQRIRELLKGKIGYGLYDLKLKKIKSELLQVPRVESLEVFRRWPDTLIVNVVERPAVAIAFKGDKLMLVDRYGKWIEELRTPKGLPLLVGADGGHFPLEEVCAWIFSIQSAGEPSYLSFSKIDEISWSSTLGLVIRSASLDVKVTLGFTDFEKRWDRAQKAYFYSYQKGRLPNWVDASNLRRIILSSGEGAVASANSGSHTVF